MAYYADTSALVKLVLRERGSAAMARWASGHDGEVVSSDLARTELLRATRRAAPDRLPRARAVLDALVLLDVTTDAFERAGLIDPVGVRSLDAVHLAAALSLGDDLDAFVTYDERLAEAAAANGIAVLAPR